jgi:hypothetical protein
MGNILKITKLHFVSLFQLQIIICCAVLLLHLLISVAVLRLADTKGPAGVGDFIGLIWVLIIGMIFFIPSFKYTLSQGISRKTFFLGGSLSITMIAAILAVLVTIFYAINLKVSNVWMIYDLIYHDQGLVGLVVWEFATFLFFGMLGWFIRLVYYISSRNTLSPSVLLSWFPY